MRRIAAFTALLALAGCATQPTPSAPLAEFLAFGDGGYHYDFLEPKDGAGILTPDAYLAHERAEWIDDKRPLAEFRAGPSWRRPDTGGYVNASGQAGVASAMQRYCKGPAKCEFAVMLGDNIYPDGATRGKDGHEDAERFRKVLFEPYAPLGGLAESFRIYSVLGNHDWRTSREAALDQVRYLTDTRPFYMNGLMYRVAPTGDPREVEIFAIDTHVLLSKYSIEDDALDDDGREVPSGKIDPPQAWALPQTDDEWRMDAWLEEALASSPARWKIVIGHHPIWSSAGSKYHQARLMRKLILPSLCRHADLYLAGHEHTLEAYTDGCKDVPEAKGRPPLPEVVSGAAGKQRPLNTNFGRFQLAEHPELTSLYAVGLTWGFAHVTLSADKATIQLISIPDDGSDTPTVVFEHSFARRSGR